MRPSHRLCLLVAPLADLACEAVVGERVLNLAVETTAQSHPRQGELANGTVSGPRVGAMQ